eukprot:1137619-Pelagomonas_calceolata.AAC.6
MDRPSVPPWIALDDVGLLWVVGDHLCLLGLLRIDGMKRAHPPQAILAVQQQRCFVPRVLGVLCVMDVTRTPHVMLDRCTAEGVLCVMDVMRTPVSCLIGATSRALCHECCAQSILSRCLGPWVQCMMRAQRMLCLADKCAANGACLDTGDR